MWTARGQWRPGTSHCRAISPRKIEIKHELDGGTRRDCTQAQPSKQVAERTFRERATPGHSTAVGVVARGAVDTTIGTGASWCGDGGLFHRIHNLSRTSPHHRSRDQRHDNHNKDKRLSDRGPRNAEKALAQLIAVLDTQDMARAIDRLEKGHGAARGETKSHSHSNGHPTRIAGWGIPASLIILVASSEDSSRS